MTTIESPPVSAPWAFWAPASDSLMAAALDLAGLRPGERFLDLGCGDGRVMVAAARRGALVSGIEIDPRMAARARANLAAEGVAGTVIEADMFQSAIDADVVYAYLTPVTVARLKLSLASAKPGTRLVTPAFPVCDWQVEKVEATCRLYRLPARQQPPPTTPGWGCRALLMNLRAGRRNLIPMIFDSPGGDVRIEADALITRSARIAQSATHCEAPSRVAIDLIFEPCGAGTVIAGELRIGCEALTIAAVFTASETGMWRFGPGDGEAFRRTLNEQVALLQVPGASK